MQTMTKTASKTSVKQKVIVGVAVVAILAGLGGLMSTIGKARGFGFGWPVVKRTITVDKKTMLPAYNEGRLCTIRSTTGGTIKVPCTPKKTEVK